MGWAGKQGRAAQGGRMVARVCFQAQRWGCAHDAGGRVCGAAGGHSPLPAPPILWGPHARQLHRVMQESCPGCTPCWAAKKRRATLRGTKATCREPSHVRGRRSACHAGTCLCRERGALQPVLLLVPRRIGGDLKPHPARAVHCRGMAGHACAILKQSQQHARPCYSPTPLLSCHLGTAKSSKPGLSHQRTRTVGRARAGSSLSHAQLDSPFWQVLISVVTALTFILGGRPCSARASP